MQLNNQTLNVMHVKEFKESDGTNTVAFWSNSQENLHLSELYQLLDDCLDAFYVSHKNN